MSPGRLVLGYGNELRRDDGIGPRIAREVLAWGRADVEGLCLHQLVPELASRLAEVEEVIFVDACLGIDDVVIESIVPQRNQSPGHRSDPPSLLGLAQMIHGRAPRAWLVRVPAVDFDYGEELSPFCASHIDAVLNWIEERSCTKSG
jgi:hydrogenase maturation protease